MLFWLFAFVSDGLCCLSLKLHCMHVLLPTSVLEGEIGLIPDARDPARFVYRLNDCSSAA